jgi:hypothetical protein
MACEALLLGGVTYEGFAGAWPSRTGEFADKFNGMPKYVVSGTLVRALMEHDPGRRVPPDGVPTRSRQRQAPLFEDPGAGKALRPVDSKPVGPDGVIILTYRPALKA